mmetsp:Transcript_35048/g.56717  ORF Transcript_35048/g.56717 Transcript_35048/m.56717 type:complete len:93 (-) Transcript_35048:2676-2954(-)
MLLKNLRNRKAAVKTFLLLSTGTNPSSLFLPSSSDGVFEFTDLLSNELLLLPSNSLAEASASERGDFGEFSSPDRAFPWNETDLCKPLVNAF